MDCNKKVEDFKGITGCDNDGLARDYLVNNNENMDSAINAFYDRNGRPYRTTAPPPAPVVPERTSETVTDDYMYSMAPPMENYGPYGTYADDVVDPYAFQHHQRQQQPQRHNNYYSQQPQYYQRHQKPQQQQPQQQREYSAGADDEGVPVSALQGVCYVVAPNTTDGMDEYSVGGMQRRLPFFRTPTYALPSRYTSTSFTNNSYVPLEQRFRACCRCAEEQQRHVLLVAVNRTNDSIANLAFLRDVMNDGRSAGVTSATRAKATASPGRSDALENIFCCFVVDVDTDILHMLHTASVAEQEARAATDSKVRRQQEVARMLSAYGWLSDEARTDWDQTETVVEMSLAEKHKNTGKYPEHSFLSHPGYDRTFPIVAVIEPSSGSVSHRFSMASLLSRDGISFSQEEFFAQVTEILQGKQVVNADNFFQVPEASSETSPSPAAAAAPATEGGLQGYSPSLSQPTNNENIQAVDDNEDDNNINSNNSNTNNDTPNINSNNSNTNNDTPNTEANALEATERIIDMRPYLTTRDTTGAISLRVRSYSGRVLDIVCAPDTPLYSLLLYLFALSTDPQAQQDASLESTTTSAGASTLTDVPQQVTITPKLLQEFSEARFMRGVTTKRVAATIPTDVATSGITLAQWGEWKGGGLITVSI